MRVITGTLEGTPIEAERPPRELTPSPEWVATLHEHGPLLLAAARSITGNEAEAEDYPPTETTSP